MTGPFEPIRHPGNQGLFRALELSLLSTHVGLPLHVHAEGLRGTGKTTIIRSLRRRLPSIQRIKGCPFNCSPWAPHCPEHRKLGPAEVAAVGREWVAMPFREISHSAKIGTVAGSIDLARIADRSNPEAAILPGTIAQAGRGIVFVDEINRLADTAPELADILLDVMGTKPGRLQVEESGLPSVDLPVSVSVWAASNPDEDPGPLEDIRKQLSDRFDFVIAMERPSSLAAVREILRRQRDRQAALAGAGVPCLGLVNEPPGEAELTGRGGALGPTDWLVLSEAVRGVQFPPAVEDLIASLYVDYGLESLRGVEAIHHGARMNCVLEDRRVVSVADVAAVAPAALQHRLDVSTFSRVLDHLTQQARGVKTDDIADEERAPDGTEGGRRAEQPATPAVESLGRAASATTGASGSGTAPAASPGAGVEPSLPGATPAPPGGNRSWLNLRDLFGRRSRVADEAAGAVGGSGRGRPASGGSHPGAASRPGESGSGGTRGARVGGEAGRGGFGARGDPWPDSEERPVAPPHPARSLSEILREMELCSSAPRGPRLP